MTTTNTFVNSSLRPDGLSIVADFTRMTKKKGAGRIWKGYYEQHGVTHEMVFKRFKAKQGDKVKGKGRDEIGVFSIRGKVGEDGAVDFKKEYKGRHTVAYMGRMQGKDIIEGEWEVSGATGSFKIEVRINQGGVFKNLINQPNNFLRFV